MTSFDATAVGRLTDQPVSSSEVDAVLEASSALLAQRRWHEAIELLSAANRGRRETDIERRLVRVRHDAFERIEHSTPSNWPPRGSWRVPRGRPPEVSASELDGDVLTSCILGQGGLLVRGLVPRSSVDRLVNGIDRALAAAPSGGSRSGDDPSPDAGWFETFQPDSNHDRGTIGAFLRSGGGIFAADSPRLLFELLEIVGEAGVPDLIAGHLGEQPALSVNKTTLRRVNKDTAAEWHQDGAFMGTDIRSVNLWLALSHCGDDAPGLDLLPRRLNHIVETGTEGTIFEWAASPTMVERAAEGINVCRPIFEPGDAMLFDHMYMHRTAAGPEMTKARYGVEMWFFAPSLYPRDQIPLIV